MELMTLDEAIQHCEEVAEENERKCTDGQLWDVNEKRRKCAAEHRQRAEWLKDYKRLKEREGVLDKIKIEIEQIEINGSIRDVECFRAGINTALYVINKHRAESEDKE